MKTINLDIQVTDYNGGYRFTKDLYIHPGHGGEIDTEMIRLELWVFVLLKRVNIGLL